MPEERKLRMNFAGRFIDLLGQQMYGGPVPSVAELVANAWDADANEVEINIPEDLTESGAEIVVKDKGGSGMNFEEINEYYLNVGYERRKRGENTPGGRPVMGRKGIGKLAGFGIAEDIIIISVNDGDLVEFNLNYTDLKSKQTLEGFEFKPTRDEQTDEPNGVTVIYRNLKSKQKINIDNFRKSMGRRFALGKEQMKVIVNGEEITHDDLDFEYRTPDNDDWQEEDVPGFGKVSYWFGFLRKTIQESELRGVSVFARGRVAQFTPFVFNLTGGINGQIGLEYLTGQVKCEELDEKDDYIATDRQTVNWQLGKAPILEKWGQDKIKELCKGWKKRREKEKAEKFVHNYSELAPLIKPLQEQERKDLTAALDKIAKLDNIDVPDFMVIARSMISGVQRESVQKVIKRINATDENSLDILYESIKEWDIISAVSIAEVVKGKIEIIKQFEKHIIKRTPEKSKGDLPDMQTFVKEHPWLLGQEYEQFTSEDIYHEQGVERWIREVIDSVDKKYKTKKSSARRFDLLCVKDRREIKILELMRPGLPADYDHLIRLQEYVASIRASVASKGTSEKYVNVLVSGLLIADRFAEEPVMMDTLQKFQPTINAVEWHALFEEVKGLYKDYFNLLIEKAPNDPRIKGLEAV